MNQENSLTFITSIINVYTPFENKDIYWQLEKFRIIAKTGIQLCVYICPQYLYIFTEIIRDYPNIKIMKVISLQETQVVQQYNQLQSITLQTITLPDNRNEKKDTVEFILIGHSNIELMQDAIQQNPYKSTHFAWIDCDIAELFKDTVKSQEFLKTLAIRTLNPSFITLPGCWPKITPQTEILNNICWRFCGGFIIGDKDSILELHNLYQLHFRGFMENSKKLVWPVNFWAWLELEKGWNPIWFHSGHDDSIIRISASLCSIRILGMASSKEIKYDYPVIDGYYPASAAYIQVNAPADTTANASTIHLLNTRYVNYRLTPQGQYIINDPAGKIISKNICCELDEDFWPKYYKEMQDPQDLPIYNSSKFQGLEDIRLFLDESTSQPQFIASTICYSPGGRSRMVIGNYDVDKLTYTECRVLEPPDKNSWCEKNWTTVTGGQSPLLCIAKTNPPLCNVKANLIENNNEKGGSYKGGKAPLYLYGWSPQQIGNINPETNQLEIHTTHPVTAPYFERVRGSTQFIDYISPNDQTMNGKYLVGVVHFSEETVPRNYFHILVLLEKETLKLVKYSETFYFDKVGIEFCIGFTSKENRYYFWISKFDRDPALVSISMDSIVWI
jgi:hypothetical protein